MKISEHFDLKELVSPEIYNRSNIKNRAFDFINVNVITVLEQLRAEYGPITINTWHNGGSYKNSGLRAPDTDVGAKYSAHKFGTAFDLKFSDTVPPIVYSQILLEPDKWPFIRRMEDANETKTWLHIEVSTLEREGEIYTFKP